MIYICKDSYKQSGNIGKRVERILRENISKFQSAFYLDHIGLAA